MTDFAISLATWQAVYVGTFVACIAFTVCSLELLRYFLTHWPRAEMQRKANWVAAVLGAIFVAMLVGGVGDYFVVRALTFLNLTFFLTGAAGAGILGELMWRFHHGTLDDAESRRIAAHDL